MNLHQLRFVQEAVRRNLNLTETARALHTSQPGVSKAIRELEQELGVDLFVRHGKRLTRITEPGQQMLPSVEAILREVANLKRPGARGLLRQALRRRCRGAHQTAGAGGDSWQGQLGHGDQGLTGSSVANTFTVTGANSGTATGTGGFSAIGNLIGGSSTDSFVLHLKLSLLMILLIIVAQQFGELRGQLGQILRDADATLNKLQHFHLFGSSFGAEN